MFESKGLSFLKKQSIPDQALKSLIALCDSVDSAFSLIDTQFLDKASELRSKSVDYLCSKKTTILNIKQLF